MSEFNLKVIDIIDQPDGSAIVTFDIDKKTREFIKSFYGWKKWNKKKFEKVLIELLDNYVKMKEKKDD
jgi:hypothetical protein